MNGMRLLLGVSGVALLMLAGCARQADEPTPTAPAGSTAVDEAAKADEPAEPRVEDLQAVVVPVYFADKELQHLEAEARDVATDPEQPAVTARAAVQELLDGPKEEGHERVIAKGTTVHSVQVASGMATVDLSAEFVDKFQGGTMVAHLAVYSVVNTVAGIEGIERVQILVAGQVVDEFAGAEVLKDPLEPDLGLMGGEKL